MAKKLNEKLNPRFYGPYRISKVIGKVAYHLNLPLESNVHPVFHVSLLKKAIALAMKPQPLPPMLTDELELRVEPQVVKVVKNHPAGTTEVLIQWKDLPDFEATWELVDFMKQQFFFISP